MKTKIQPILFPLILIYLTCYFARIFRFPDVLILLIGAMFCLYYLIDQKKLRVNFGLCLLTVTMFSHCIIKFGWRAVAIMMPYIPVLIYVLATYLAAEIKKDQNPQIRLTQVLYSMAFGHAVYGILNAYMYFSGTGIEGTRYWVDFWTKQMTPGTQLTVYCMTILAMLFPSILYFYRRKVSALLTVLLSLFFVYFSLAARSRTTILAFVLVFCGQAVLYAILEREQLMKNVTKKKVGIFAACIAAAILVLTILLKDSAVVVEFIEKLGKDGGILHNVRFTAQREALQQLFDHPMGGNQMQLSLRMVHNTWLDMANGTGLIPFFAFAAYTVWTLYELIRFLRKKGVDTEGKLMIAGIYVSFFLYYTVEPALDASIHFMTPWMLINGMVHEMISEK